MQKAIRTVMSGGEDNVRYYLLCQARAKSVEVFGGKPLAKTANLYVV